MSDKVVVGKSANDVVESEMGGRSHVALLLSDLETAAEAAVAAFEYETGWPARALVQLALETGRMAGDLSVANDGSLTFNRECARCSGAGSTHGENPCIECDGRGYVHMSEVDS